MNSIRSDATKLRPSEKLKLRILRDLSFLPKTFFDQAPFARSKLLELSQKRLPGGGCGPFTFALRRLPPQALLNSESQVDPFNWLLKAIDVSGWRASLPRQLLWLERVWHAAASHAIGWRRVLDREHGWSEAVENFAKRPDDLDAAKDRFISQLRSLPLGEKDEFVLKSFCGTRVVRLSGENTIADERAFERRIQRAMKEEGARKGMVASERFLVHYWLALDSQFPGLCFFSDSALHEFLEILRLNVGKDLPGTKRLRQRLGLIQAGAKTHLIETVLDFGGELRFMGGGVPIFVLTGPIAWPVGATPRWQPPR